MKKALVLSILGGMVAGVVAVILLIRFFPSNEDFNLDNPFWNGLKSFREETGVFSLGQISDLSLVPSSSGTILFIIGPSAAYNSQKISAISSYLNSGGALILADDFGSGNSILKGLGLESRFSHHLVVDPLFRGKSSLLAKTVDTVGPLADIKRLMFNYPTSLQVNDFGGEIVASSSSFSFFDDNLNGKREESEDEGPFPMIARIPYGKGEIYLMADSSLFINSMLDEAENREFLQTIMQRKRLFVDTSHYPVGILSRLRNIEITIYEIISRLEVRYALFLVLVINIVWLRLERKKAGYEEDIESVLKRHPEWDKETLKYVQGSMFKVENKNVETGSRVREKRRDGDG
ncbi:hypothetical protein ES708_02164 [subsurface metagenome]